MPTLPRVRGVDAKTTFMTLLIPSLAIFVYVTMLGPMVDTLHLVEPWCC